VVVNTGLAVTQVEYPTLPQFVSSKTQLERIRSYQEDILRILLLLRKFRPIRLRLAPRRPQHRPRPRLKL
jgi:hypothetical protein